MGLLKLKQLRNRTTPLHAVILGDVTITFSYEAAVAMEDRRNNVHIRRRNHWGATTAKHMKEAGVIQYDEVKDDDFEKAVGVALTSAITQEAENV